MGTPAPEGPPAGLRVRVSRPAIEALEHLSAAHRRAVAEAIVSIGPDQGVPLVIPPGKGSGGKYLAIVPDDDAPVVVYRRLRPDEGGGYLVTAIVGRDEYEGYRRAEQQGILDSPLARIVLAAVLGAGAGAILSRARPPVGG